MGTLLKSSVEIVTTVGILCGEEKGLNLKIPLLFAEDIFTWFLFQKYFVIAHFIYHRNMITTLLQG